MSKKIHFSFFFGLSSEKRSLEKDLSGVPPGKARRQAFGPQAKMRLIEHEEKPPFPSEGEKFFQTSERNARLRENPWGFSRIPDQRHSSGAGNLSGVPFVSNPRVFNTFLTGKRDPSGSLLPVKKRIIHSFWKGRTYERTHQGVSLPVKGTRQL